jgi:hypothetical protein
MQLLLALIATYVGLNIYFQKKQKEGIRTGVDDRVYQDSRENNAYYTDMRRFGPDVDLEYLKKQGVKIGMDEHMQGPSLNDEHEMFDPFQWYNNMPKQVQISKPMLMY